MSVDKIHSQVSGVPTHSARPGAMAVDIATGAQYVRTQALSWVRVAGTFQSAFTSAPFQGGSVMPVDDVTIERMIGSGMLADAVAAFTGAGSSGIVRTTTGGIYVILSPGGNVGEYTSVSSPSTLYGPEALSECLVKFHFVNLDRSRLWIGFFGNALNGLQTNNPADNHAALRFANADSNFQFVSKQGTQSVVDSTITPVNGTTYYFGVSLSAGQAVLTLYDATFAVLATHTETAFPPSGTSDMRLHIVSENEAVAGARNIGVYFANVQNKAV